MNGTLKYFKDGLFYFITRKQTGIKIYYQREEGQVFYGIYFVANLRIRLISHINSIID